MRDIPSNHQVFFCSPGYSTDCFGHNPFLTIKCLMTKLPFVRVHEWLTKAASTKNNFFFQKERQVFYWPLLQPHNQNQNIGHDQDHESLCIIIFHPSFSPPALLGPWAFMFVFYFHTVYSLTYCWHCILLQIEDTYLRPEEVWSFYSQQFLWNWWLSPCSDLNTQPERSLYEHAQAHISIWVWVALFGGGAVPAQDSVKANVFLWSTTVWEQSQWYFRLLAWVKTVGFGSLCGCICFIFGRLEHCICEKGY